MGKLIYFTPTSLDGFLGVDGDHGWSVPDEEVFAFINALMRPMGTYLYGRRNYETMAVWDAPEKYPELTDSEAQREFARMWQAAEKIVYSRTLQKVATGNTRLEREFVASEVRKLKAEREIISVAGPTLAAEAIRAGLVDEIHLLLVPYLLGGGRRVLPEGVRTSLKLEEERRLAGGWVYVRYIVG